MKIFLAIADDDTGYHYRVFTTHGVAAEWLSLYARTWVAKHANPDMVSLTKGYNFDEIAEVTGYQLWLGIEELELHEVPDGS
jgi:hypothetical protein